MCASGVIRSDLDAVTAAQNALKHKADVFKTIPVDFNKETNIAVVGNANAAYVRITSLLADIKESLLADSGHIGQMGEEFVAVDAMLAAQIRNNL